MFNAHLDTVAVDGMTNNDAFSARVDGDRLFGRGSLDMKASVASMLTAVKALTTTPRLRGDVVFAAVADEEHGSLGTREVIAHGPKVDAAIVTEPTSLDICTAHKGYVWIDVTIEGRAAHGSRYDVGIDANMKMGRFLHELSALERELRERRTPHAIVGSPSLHVGLVSGGTGER